MPYANNDGVRIHYHVEGDGPPLVLQHWSLATLEGWYDYGYVAALKEDYRLILLDGRGHGDSDKPRLPKAYGPRERVGDITAVLDHLGIAKAHYFGYSMGGWIGYCVAKYAPRRFYSLIIGGQHPYAQSMEDLRQLIRVGIEQSPEALLALWEEGGEPETPETRQRMLDADYEVLTLVARDRESMEDVLPSITQPCLLYAGDQDEVYSWVKACAALIPHATFLTFPGMDHSGLLRRSDLVVPHIKAFLEKVA